MIQIMDAFLAIFAFWGAFVGLFIAIIITWMLSILLWGEFRVEVFVGLAVPLLMAGAYIQYLIEKRNGK